MNVNFHFHETRISSETVVLLTLYLLLSLVELDQIYPLLLVPWHTRLARLHFVPRVQSLRLHIDVQHIPAAIARRVVARRTILTAISAS